MINKQDPIWLSSLVAGEGGGVPVDHQEEFCYVEAVAGLDALAKFLFYYKCQRKTII